MHQQRVRNRGRDEGSESEWVYVHADGSSSTECTDRRGWRSYHEHRMTYIVAMFPADSDRDYVLGGETRGGKGDGFMCVLVMALTYPNLTLSVPTTQYPYPRPPCPPYPYTPL